MFDTGKAISSATSLRSLGGKLSGPPALFGLTLNLPTYLAKPNLPGGLPPLSQLLDHLETPNFRGMLRVL